MIDKLTYAGRLQNIKPLLKSKRITFVKSDICNLKLMKKILTKTDILINAAAESHVDNSFGNAKIFSKTNIIGTQTLLEACRFNKVNKIIISKPIIKTEVEVVIIKSLKVKETDWDFLIAQPAIINKKIRTIGRNARNISIKQNNN